MWQDSVYLGVGKLPLQMLELTAKSFAEIIRREIFTKKNDLPLKKLVFSFKIG